LATSTFCSSAFFFKFTFQMRVVPPDDPLVMVEGFSSQRASVVARYPNSHAWQDIDRAICEVLTMGDKVRDQPV
jgi:hypothetical protein